VRHCCAVVNDMTARNRYLLIALIPVGDWGREFWAALIKTRTVCAVKFKVQARTHFSGSKVVMAVSTSVHLSMAASRKRSPRCRREMITPFRRSAWRRQREAHARDQLDRPARTHRGVADFAPAGNNVDVRRASAMICTICTGRPGWLGINAGIKRDPGGSAQ